MKIAKVTDGFFTVNEFLVSFRWRDFSINSDLPYVKLGERPLICSSICVKKGGILHRMQCPSHGHCRKRVVGVLVPGVNQVVYLSIRMKILLFV